MPKGGMLSRRGRTRVAADAARAAAGLEAGHASLPAAGPPVTDKAEPAREAEQARRPLAAVHLRNRPPAPAGRADPFAFALASQSGFAAGCLGMSAAKRPLRGCMPFESHRRRSSATPGRNFPLQTVT